MSLSVLLVHRIVRKHLEQLGGLEIIPAIEWEAKGA